MQPLVQTFTVNGGVSTAVTIPVHATVSVNVNFTVNGGISIAFTITVHATVRVNVYSKWWDLNRGYNNGTCNRSCKRLQ